MNDQDLATMLEDVRSGALTPDDALTVLRRLPYADLGYARVDHHRELRQGWPEAIYAPGKAPDQCAEIAAELLANGSGPVLLTRANNDQASAALARNPGGEKRVTRAGSEPLHLVTWRSSTPRAGSVLVVTAGTADQLVATECCGVLKAFGFSPQLLADCGVAGLHRILEHRDTLAKADALVVVAGMEGALASVIGGLSPAPIIAVPSSVGYGSSLEGVTALLAMHASCAAGVTVVGIDNGYGAACAVARLLR
jgi:NCAIR mutase (PurE)-related protein